VFSWASTLGVHAETDRRDQNPKFFSMLVRHLRKMRRVVLKHLKLEKIEEETSISLSLSVL